MLQASLLISKIDHLNLLNYADLGQLQGQETMIKVFALKSLSCLEKWRWESLLHRMVSAPSCLIDHCEIRKKAGCFCCCSLPFTSRLTGSGWHWLPKCWSVTDGFLLVPSTRLLKKPHQTCFNIFCLLFKAIFIILQALFCGPLSLNNRAIFWVLI